MACVARANEHQTFQGHGGFIGDFREKHRRKYLVKGVLFFGLLGLESGTL